MSKMANVPGKGSQQIAHADAPPAAQNGNGHAMRGMDDMAGMPGMQAQPLDAMAAQAQPKPWAHVIAAMILGVWLITSPAALDYRSTALSWSDVISGTLIIVFAIVTLTRRSAWSTWASSLVGVWLLAAPLVFHAPTAAGSANDTISGALVIVFVLLMPGMPGMRMQPGPDAPPGWSYNPSSWLQRAPIIALAFVGFFLSRQMSAYQLGYTTTVWEPFFNPGTRAVLTSAVSRSFPVSDAGLGAFAYMIEALMGFMGDKYRWRTMPWMVMFFGILVVPLGIASISLIILQPVSVGHWCTPCLIAALSMLIMIALTLDEVVAMVSFLVLAKREGQSLWRTFWLGGTLKTTEQAAPPVRPDVISLRAMVWGVMLPWNLLLSIAAGLWLMLSPSVFGTVDLFAHSNHILGALVVTVAIIALSDVGRIARYINVLFGLWFIVSPWLLAGGTTVAALNDVIIGVALIVFSLPRGPVGERYGSWQRFIR